MYNSNIELVILSLPAITRESSRDANGSKKFGTKKITIIYVCRY